MNFPTTVLASTGSHDYLYGIFFLIIALLIGAATRHFLSRVPLPFTVLLLLIGLAMGWKKGDVILTTPISFLATSNAIVYSGATPEFVDIENTFYNIDTQKFFLLH